MNITQIGVDAADFYRNKPCTRNFITYYFKKAICNGREHSMEDTYGKTQEILIERNR